MKVKVLEKDGFDIFFEALPEDGTLRDLLPDESEESLKQIYNDNCIFVAKVTAEKIGVVLGQDYLGGCIYVSEEEFYTTYKDEYFTDMVENAIQDGKKEGRLLIKELAKIVL